MDYNHAPWPELFLCFLCETLGNKGDKGNQSSFCEQHAQSRMTALNEASLIANISSACYIAIKAAEEKNFSHVSTALTSALILLQTISQMVNLTQRL